MGIFIFALMWFILGWLTVLSIVHRSTQDRVETAILMVGIGLMSGFAYVGGLFQ